MDEPHPATQGHPAVPLARVRTIPRSWYVHGHL